MWEWSRTESSGRYVYAYIPGHPNADPRGRVLEHRAVMENVIGRVLSTDEHVHHDNEDGKDNAITNLVLLSKSEHSRLHMIERNQRPLTHGRAGYLRGCKCATCRAGNAEHSRRYKERRRNRSVV